MTTADEVARWWGTSVSRIEPGVIELRGRPVQELIGSASLVSVIWLLLRGSRPAPAEEALLEAALVASVDHGPQAPSIAAGHPQRWPLQYPHPCRRRRAVGQSHRQLCHLAG